MTPQISGGGDESEYAWVATGTHRENVISSVVEITKVQKNLISHSRL